MKILISSDSLCDLPKSELKKHNIEILSIPITLGNEIFLDGVEITPEKIFEYVEKNKTLPKTSAINEYTYREFFENHLKNYEAIIHFTISSKMSLCYENAKKASEGLENVFVIDSTTLTSGIGLLILKACELREKGKTVNEIVNYINSQKQNPQVSFVIETLEFLHKGGRCSSLQFFGANLLKLRPSIKCVDGKLEVNKKYKGKMTDVVESYILDTLKENPNYDNSYVFITHTASDEILQKAEETLKQLANFKQIFKVKASSTITTHCGKNTLGIIYLNK